MRSRKVSSWQGIQGVRESFASKSRRRPSSEHLSPWTIDNWSFDPAQISVFNPGPKDRERKPGDTFDNSSEIQGGSFFQFDGSPIVRLVTMFLLLMSAALMVFLIALIW